MANQEYPDLPFVPPRAWGKGRDGNSVQYIVVHHTAGSERATSAEDGARYDQRRTDGTSTHYFVDQNSTVQCVYTWDRANAAYHYGNRRGIQYELCGTLQTRAQWLDPASDATLWLAAKQMARDCKKYGLPVRKLTPAEMRAGQKGICGHADVTAAYGLGDHTDPGPWFPYDVLLARINHYQNGTAPTPQGDDEEMKGILANVTGKQTVFYGTTRHGDFRALSWPESLSGLTIAGATRMNFDKPEALVETCGWLPGDTDGSKTLALVESCA